MNIQEISRLHEHYARPTLVIEMPAELQGQTSRRLLSAPTGEATVSPVWQRIKGSWRSIGLCLCLVIAAGFGGSFLGSIHKEPAKRDRAAQADLIPEAANDAPASAQRSADTSAPVATAPAAVAPEAPSAAAAASTSAAAISASAPHNAQPAVSEPARPIAPRPVAAVQAPAPKPPVKVEPAVVKPASSSKPGSDVKMF